MEGRAEASRMEAREGSEKPAGNKKQLLPRSGSGSNRTPARRRWSSSTDLDIEAAAAGATPTSAAAMMLSRSYSTTAAVAAADAAGGGGGGVRQQQQQQQQARGGGEGERPRRRGGAAARLSRKLKEQRARFYIVRRCVSMLVCWHEHDDADDAD